MKRLLVALGALSLLALVALVAPPATAGDVATYTVQLTGANEVPGPGDPDGMATATVQFGTVTQRGLCHRAHGVGTRDADALPHPPGARRCRRSDRRRPGAGADVGAVLHDDRPRPHGRAHHRARRLLPEHPQRGLPRRRDPRPASRRHSPAVELIDLVEHHRDDVGTGRDHEAELHRLAVAHRLTFQQEFELGGFPDATSRRSDRSCRGRGVRPRHRGTLECWTTSGHAHRRLRVHHAGNIHRFLDHRQPGRGRW